MKTDNIVLIVIVAIIAVLVIYNLVKKEEYQVRGLEMRGVGTIKTDSNDYLRSIIGTGNTGVQNNLNKKAWEVCKNEFGWDGKTVKKAGCIDSANEQNNTGECRKGVYCYVDTGLLKIEQPEKYQKWKSWF
jgi:hypothetical protein